ncbi:hypothetical protein KDM41_02025 [bacterium]|nr:hypothetical protein [bacterium]
MHATQHGAGRPAITILAAGDPLAGDVAACLSGRYEAEPVLNPATAAASISAGARGLIVFADAELPEEIGRLVRLALARHCRVVILGHGGLGPDADLERAIVRLPRLPSPRDLFDTFADIGPDAHTAHA